MAFKKEEFQALIEREGVMDFIWARSYKEKSDIGIYELANDRWGTAIFIFPPVFANVNLQREMASLYNSVELPNNSSMQIFAFASRNISVFRDLYNKAHGSFSNIERTEALKELKENMEEWLKRHANESVFGERLDFRIRNFVNLITVTIPKKDKHGIEFSERQVYAFFNRLRSQMSFLYPQNCSQTEYIKIMREILIPDAPLWYPPKDTNTFLNYQVVDNDSVMTIEDEYETIGLGKMISKQEFEEREQERIVAKQEKKRGFLGLFSKKDEEDRIAYTKWHAKVLTTKMYPAEIALVDMASILYDYFGERDAPPIPCPFFASLIIYFQDREKMKLEVTQKAQWNIWQTQTLGKAAKYFPKIIERAKEAESINKLVADGMATAYATLSLVLMDDKIEKVEKYAEIIKTQFLNHKNWVWQDESLIPHWIFLYHLPINFEPFVLKDLAKRMNTVFSENIATITPLVTGFKGVGMPVLTYVDRNGQICGVDIFESDTNYNAIVVGETGSGKSYTMADLFMNYLMNGAKIRVIDVGESYRGLCQFVGGKYIEFSPESNACFNFFTNIKTVKEGDRVRIHEEEMESIVPLIGLMAMTSLYAEDVSDTKTSALIGKIEQAVQMAHDMKQHNAGMQEVVMALEKLQDRYKSENKTIDEELDNLINALYPFGNPNGDYFKYFNGPNNIHFEDNDFVVFEIQELENKNQLKSVILASMIHMINKEFFLGSREKKKIMAIDEAWSLLSDRNVARYTEKSARRIRKHKGSLIVITQSITDLTKNDATRAILINSEWRFFLQQRPDSIAQAKNNPDLKFSDSVISLLPTITKKSGLYSEMMVEQSGRSFMIVRVVPDKVAHWVYTTHEDDMSEIRKIMKEKGISEIDARLIKGYSEKYGTTVEEEFIKRAEKGALAYTLE